MAIFSWHVMFWTLGEYMLTHEKSDAAPEIAEMETETETEAETEIETQGRVAEDGSASENMWWMLRRVCHPNIVAIVIGAIIANIAYLQDLFIVKDEDADVPKRPPLAFMTSAANTLGSSAVGLTITVMSGTIGKRIMKFEKGWLRAFIGHGASDMVLSLVNGRCGGYALAAPPSSRPTSTMEHEIGDVSTPPHSMHVSQGTETTRVVDVDMVHSSSSCTSPTSEQAMPPTNEFASSLLAKIVLVRVLLIALVQFFLTYLLSPLVFPDSADSKLIRLVLFIQAVSPSANLTVVACQQVGKRLIAEAMAISILFQHLIIAMVMVPSTALAISIVYGDS